jgi:hypothetical protein
MKALQVDVLEEGLGVQELTPREQENALLGRAITTPEALLNGVETGRLKLSPRSTSRGEESFGGDEIGGFEPLGEAAVDVGQQLGAPGSLAALRARTARGSSRPATPRRERPGAAPRRVPDGSIARRSRPRSVLVPGGAAPPWCGAAPQGTIPLPSAPRAPAPCRPQPTHRQPARQPRDPQPTQEEAAGRRRSGRPAPQLRNHLAHRRVRSCPWANDRNLPDHSICKGWN